MEIEKSIKVGILGTGTMGVGISIAVASSGLNAILKTRQNKAGALDAIQKKLGKYVEKGEISTEDKNRILQKIYVTTNMEELTEAEIVIEAAIEDLVVKRNVLYEIGKLASSALVIATTTSSFTISEISSSLYRPDRFIGMHFFNPADKIPLVEIIRGEHTSNKTQDLALIFAKKLGKEAILVKDTPGFIVNRLLIPMINDAATLVMKGIATPSEIDKAMEMGAKHPIGPLALADFIGIDICLSIIENFQERLGEERYKPCQIFKEMIENGQLGKKTGYGFYSYANQNTGRTQ